MQGMRIQVLAVRIHLGEVLSGYYRNFRGCISLRLNTGRKYSSLMQWREYTDGRETLQRSLYLGSAVKAGNAVVAVKEGYDAAVKL